MLQITVLQTHNSSGTTSSRPDSRDSARNLNFQAERAGETGSLPPMATARPGSHQLCPQEARITRTAGRIPRPATRLAFPSSSSSFSSPSPPAACLCGRRLRLCFPPRFHSPHVILCYCKERSGARARGARTYKYGHPGWRPGTRRQGGPGAERPGATGRQTDS